MCLKLVCTFIILFNSNVVLLSPVSVQSSSSILDDHTQLKKADAFDTESKKGITAGHTTSGFNREDLNKHGVAQNSGFYNNENNDKNHRQQAGKFLGENYHNQNAGGVSKVGQKAGHRKGHHKTGFQNSYHKEEAEDNSSYYDDSDDQGGHFTYGSQDGSYGVAAADRNQGSYEDGNHYLRGNAQRGYYDADTNFGNERGDRKLYNQQQFFNDRRDEGKSNFGNIHGEAGRHVEDSYYREPYYNKYPPRRTITVYEDPREFEYSTRHSQYPEYEHGYDVDPIRLDYRRNPLPYYSTQPDYYYY